MGSLRWNGVLFAAYPNDHWPPHIHCFSGEAEVILELRSDRSIGFADRQDAVTPRNAKRSDVKRVLRTAAAHFDELVQLWEANRG